MRVVYNIKNPLYLQKINILLNNIVDFGIFKIKYLIKQERICFLNGSHQKEPLRYPCCAVVTSRLDAYDDKYTTVRYIYSVDEKSLYFVSKY